MAVWAGFTAPMLGKKLVSTTYRLSRSWALQLASSTEVVGWHRQVIWECLWRSRCEWIGWRKVMADCVFQTAATVMIWFQTAKRLVISVRHSGALIR